MKWTSDVDVDDNDNDNDDVNDDLFQFIKDKKVHEG